MQPKPRKMLIHVAGDLQLELPLLYIISKLSTRRYWLFCGAQEKNEQTYDRLYLSIEMGAREE
jgi:hypothetical protein